MASQRGEHLLVLNQACKGLLCRVHWMTRMSTPKALDSKELVRVLRHFRQTWPKMNTEEIQQVRGDAAPFSPTARLVASARGRLANGTVP